MSLRRLFLRSISSRVGALVALGPLVVFLAALSIFSTPKVGAQHQQGFETATEPLQSPDVVSASRLGSGLAGALVERATALHLDRLVELRSEVDDTEKSLLDAHIASLTTPEALRRHLLRPRALPAEPEVGPVKRSAMTDHGAVRYMAVVPESYTPERAWPVHIALHGGGGSSRRSCLNNWQGMAAKSGIILLCPTVRRGGWWLLGGALRIRAAFEDLRGRYRVDLDRVSIGGASSGGAGVWHQATRYPWKWRAAIPRCAALPPDPQMLGNLKAVPTYLLHGARDAKILAHNSRLSHGLLNDLGYDVTYYEDARVGHNFMFDHNDEVLTWLGERERASVFADFSYRTPLRGAAPSRVWWLEPEWGAGYRPGQRLEASLKWSVGPQSPVLEARVASDSDIRSLRVFLPPLEEFKGATLTVVYNGEVVHAGTVVGTVEGLLTSWGDHRDPSMLTPFSAEINLLREEERPVLGSLGTN